MAGGYGHKRGHATRMEKYLGVPLVTGRVTKSRIAPLVDKIETELDGRTKCYLSKGELFWIKWLRHVLNSIPGYFHNMAIYKWPTSMIKECAMTILRNFIRVATINVDRKSFYGIRRLWDKSCKPPLGGRRTGQVRGGLKTSISQCS
ncbi:hypothetical protein IFM89_038410 [Coptis chinensis]|uniref:Uncharacterized protein n=1 Tax=Coptis chinensis TaxID=261450 RepID=A0A835HA80_9MAGN|nr:hypothetical protein IFM89_038410 [Coptis chinensis]